jgi:2-iminobutanoate/2-iminopropanoate deaminase
MKKIIKTSNAPAPIGPYNQAISVNNFLYVSGQIAINPETGNLIQDNLVEETTMVMKNLGAILSEAGINFKNVVKTTIFLKDMSFFKTVNEVYGSYFEGEYPARETVAVAGLPLGVNVEISVIAFLNS